MYMASNIPKQTHGKQTKLNLGVVDLALELLVLGDLPNRLHKVLLCRINESTPKYRGGRGGANLV